MAREHSIHFQKTFPYIQKQKEATYGKVEKHTAGASQIHYAENGFPVKEIRILQLGKQFNEELENEVTIISKIYHFFIIQLLLLICCSVIHLTCQQVCNI